MLKIKRCYGLTLSYDPDRKRFFLIDSDGTEMDYCTTQDEAETKAKSLSKREFKRIKIYEVYKDGGVDAGEVTSVNPDDETAWVSMSPTRYGTGRSKIDLRYSSRYFEQTPANISIIEAIKQKHLEVKRVATELRELVETLEKPINKEYFGL